MTNVWIAVVLVAVVACSATVAAGVDGASAGTAPEQLHIALRGQDYDMVVSWYTPNATATSMVQYGTASGSYTNKASGSSVSYYKGYNHDAVLEGLNAATRYYYIVGDASGGWSNETSFVAPPAVQRDQGFSAAVYGDMGVDHSQNTTTRLIAHKDDFDLFVHIGDFGYADDRLDVSKDFDKIWNEWAVEVEPLASTTPYMVNPGNHEASCHSFGDFFCPDGLKNFTAYNHRFRMPAKESGSNTNMWTSWNYGNTHWIMIDTETDYPKAPEGKDTIWQAGGFGDQLAWLKADLAKAAAQRDQYPWIIAAGHRPMYSSLNPGSNNLIWPNATGNLRAFVEDLFHEYNVDLYLCGHVHAYERQYPVYRGHVEKSYDNPTGLPQVVVGCAGNIEGHSDKWLDPVPDFNAYHNGHDFGYGELTIVNSTQLKWVFRAADSGAIADEFVLNKAH